MNSANNQATSGTIHQAERKIGELEKIIESLMDTKITKTTSTQSEIKNREQEIQTIPNTTDFTMQTSSPMMKDESTTTSTSQQPDTVDGSNQPNKHLQNSIKNIIREELKLSVGYIVEQISQTATKVDVLKDSNIDLVSLLTNKQSCNQNLFRNIPHSYPIQPNIPSPNQQPISDTDRMLTNEKNIAAEIAEMEIRPTQFFRNNIQPQNTFTEQPRGQFERPQHYRASMRPQKTCKYQARRQPEEHNFHPRQNKKFYDNKSRQYYLPQLYRKEQPSSSYNARIYNSGHHRTYNRAPTRTYRQPGPHYATRIFQNSKYNYNVPVNYNPHTSEPYFES
ncbi:hypothetical protein JTB14_015731 [Gonioctena quinquepunctata]|nr:hypothetical protein JTB14_015731 [Gonioctena quinquepunctata]